MNWKPYPYAKSKGMAQMIATGGSFVAALGKAWMLADMDNSRRLTDAFGDVLERYASIAWHVMDQSAFEKSIENNDHLLEAFEDYLVEEYRREDEERAVRK